MKYISVGNRLKPNTSHMNESVMLLQAVDRPDRDRRLGWPQTEGQRSCWSGSGSSQSPGRGIREEHVSKLFTPLSQVNI